MKKTLCIALFLFAVGCCVGHVSGCSQPPTAKQVGAVAEAGCTVLQAFAESPTEEAICATADDLVELASTIRASRADAGPGKLGRKSGQCKIVHDVCATDEELAAAIKARKVAKR